MISSVRRPRIDHVAVVGHRRQVPRGEPVAGGEGGASPVPLAQRRAAHEELADPLLVHAVECGLHAGQRQPHRARAALALRAGWTASTRSPSCRSAPARPRPRRRTGATDRPPTGPTRRRTGAGSPSAAARPVAARRWYMVGTPKNMVLAEAARRTAVSSKRSNTDGGGARREGAEQSGAEAMHMEERQAEHETVLGGPSPGRQQRRDPGQQGAVRVHRSLRLAGGPRRVDDQRVVARSAVRKGGRPGAAPRARVRSSTRTTERPPRRRLRPGLVEERQDRAGIADDVVELGGGRRRAQRDEDGTAAQHGEQRPRRRGASPGRTTAPGHPARRPVRPAPPPARRCGRRGSPRRPPRRVPSVDQDRGLRSGRPLPTPTPPGGSGPCTGAPAVGPPSGRDERPHRRRPQVIV